MFTSILHAGFGHSVRFIAMVENLRKFSNEPISCLSSYSMQNFIKSNVSKYNCNVYNLYYYQRLMRQNKKKIRNLLKKKDFKILDNLKTTSVMINDFFVETDNIKKLFSDSIITCCLYHGDIHISEYDTPKIAAFKELVCKTASQHDIFFHITLNEPTQTPDLACNYMPIPIVTRQISLDEINVKHLLGLSPKDKFILVHGGSAVMENMYVNLNIFYSAINQLKTDYRIVVASGLENNNFSFRDDIIRAPLFNNGIDLVNASELVISKPGMGILQDCIATQKPLLFLPGDFAERKLKIDLLNELLAGNLPMIEKIEATHLAYAINECISMKDRYCNAYAQVHINGAEILAKSVHLLNGIKKSSLQEAMTEIQKLSPYS